MSSTACFAASLLSGGAILAGAGPGSGVSLGGGGGADVVVAVAEASSFSKFGGGGMGLGGGAGDGVMPRAHEATRRKHSAKRPRDDISRILTLKVSMASQATTIPRVRRA
jgi:hypothetical protein